MAKRTRIHHRKLTLENLIWLKYLACCRTWVKGVPANLTFLQSVENLAKVPPANVRGLRTCIAAQKIRPFTEAPIELRRACIELAERERGRKESSTTMRHQAPDTKPGS